MRKVSSPSPYLLDLDSKPDPLTRGDEPDKGGPMDVLTVRQCPFCELRFPNRNVLEAHLREDHPERVDLDHNEMAGRSHAVPTGGQRWS
jgi:hypothetical protein